MSQKIWSFVAMEYYALILNRTYLVTIDGGRLDAKVCRGLTSVDSGAGIAGMITSQIAVHGDLADSKSYVDDRKLGKPNRANFSLALVDISSVEYTPQKKWGMGYYPHDGRVFVRTANEKREFIILGSQSGKDIASRLSTDVESARKNEG